MSAVDQVVALIDEGNPVPEPDLIEDNYPTPIDYLASLQARSNNVTQLDQRMDTDQENKRSRRVTIAAAAVVILAGIVALVLNQANQEPPPATDPVPSTTIPAPGLDATGYWVSSPTEKLFLGEDGTYAWLVVGSVRDRGVWAVTDGIISFESGDQSGNCQVRDTATASIVSAAEGTLTMMLQTDDCADRRMFDEGDTLVVEATDSFEVPAPLSAEELAWQALPLLNAPAGEKARLPNFIPALAFDSHFPLVLGVGPTRDEFVPLFLSTASDIQAAIKFVRVDDTTFESLVGVFEDPERWEIIERGDVTVDSSDGQRILATALSPRSFGADFPIFVGSDYVTYVFDVGGDIVFVMGLLSEIDLESVDTLVASIDWKELGD